MSCHVMSCHVVAPDQKTANAAVPPFDTIAKTVGFNAEKPVFFLPEPHPTMPSRLLTRNEANDIAAYRPPREIAAAAIA